MGDWPLVGRTSELGMLGRWLGDADLRGALLVGAAGVGKTRLAREFEQAARETGMATVWAVGTRSAAALPFGALATLLPEVNRGQPGHGVSRADLIRRSALGMLARAGDRRLVLVVDDAHLLDDASATLIHQLAYMERCFILASVRAGGTIPDPVTALWRDGLAQRLDLAGLEAQDITALLGEVLDGQVDAASAARLADHSKGNPLFLHALVQGAQSDGTLRCDSGVWYLARPIAPSEQLMELVEAQIGALGPRERDVLEVISYSGPLTPEQLCAVAEPPVVEALERKGLIITALNSNGPREFTLRHPLYGDVVRQRMPWMRVQSVARQLSQTFVAESSNDESSLRLAVWQLDSGRAEPEVLLEGARISRWRYDFDLAHRLAEAAVSLGAGFDAALLVAELASLLGRPEEAEAKLAELTTAAVDDEQRGLVACLRLDNLIVSMGDRAEGRRVADDMEATITDQYWRDQVAARLLVSALAGQGPRNALEVGPPLFARTKGSARLFAAFAAAFALSRGGRIAESVKMTEEAYTEHLVSTEPMRWSPCLHLWNRCQALAAAGRFAEADALAAQEYETGLAEGSPEARAWFGWHRASTVGSTGGVRTAERRAREALALFHQLGQPSLSSSVSVPLALSLALLGKPDEATAILEADALTTDPPPWTGADRGCAQAWIAVARGNISEGCELLEQAAAEGEQLADLVGTAHALHGLARLGRPDLGVDRLAELANQVEGQLVQAQASHAKALSARDPKQLYATAETFAEMGANLLAAEAAYDSALAWRQAGELRQAAAVQRKGTMLLAACEGAMTPALQGVEARVYLTRAERETAVLAATGLSNRDIADKQQLSIRTVQNRLQIVYVKLGVAGRAELRSALDQQAQG